MRFPNDAAARGSRPHSNRAMRKTVQSMMVAFLGRSFTSSLNTTRPDPCQPHGGAVKLKYRENRQRFCPKSLKGCPRARPSLSTTPFLLQEVAAARIAAFVQNHQPTFEQNPEARGPSNAVRSVSVVTAVKLTFLARLSRPFDGRHCDTVLAVRVIASII